MLDALNSLTNLAQFEVILTGDWGVTPFGVQEWFGEAVAQTTIVGITFLVSGNHIGWVKSGTPYKRFPLYGTYAIESPYGTESQPLSNKLFIQCSYSYLGNLEVRLGYSLGLRDGIGHSALLSSTEYLPEIAHSRTVQTGHLFTFASVESTPPITLYTMFLAKQDVKMRRNHIWGLHKQFLARLTSPLHEVFASGRSGELAI